MKKNYQLCLEEWEEFEKGMKNGMERYVEGRGFCCCLLVFISFSILFISFILKRVQNTFEEYERNYLGALGLVSLSFSFFFLSFSSIYHCFPNRFLMENQMAQFPLLLTRSLIICPTLPQK